MSDLRMKNFDNAIQDVNNLLVCTKIVGSDSAPKWDRKEEIMDLFSVYYWKVSCLQKLAGLIRGFWEVVNFVGQHQLVTQKC